MRNNRYPGTMGRSEQPFHTCRRKSFLRWKTASLAEGQPQRVVCIMRGGRSSRASGASRPYVLLPNPSDLKPRPRAAGRAASGLSGSSRPPPDQPVARGVPAGALAQLKLAPGDRRPGGRPRQPGTPAISIAPLDCWTIGPRPGRQPLFGASYSAGAGKDRDSGDATIKEPHRLREGAPVPHRPWRRPLGLIALRWTASEAGHSPVLQYAGDAKLTTVSPACT